MIRYILIAAWLVTTLVWRATAQSPLLDSLLRQKTTISDPQKGDWLREVIIQWNLVNPDSALHYVRKLQVYAMDKSDSSRLIEAKSFEAEYYWRKSDYKTSMVHAMEALTLAESSDNFFARRGSIYFTLGNIHLYLLNTQQAIHYYQRALKNYEEQGSKPRQVASILNNIGVVFMDAAESDKNPAYRDSAESYFKRVLARGTVANPGTLINASGNLGQIYLQRKDYTEATRIFDQWKKLEAANPSTSAKAMHYGNLGLLQLALNKPGQALQFFQDGLKAARAIEAHHEEQEYYGNLAKAYASLNQYQQAYEYAARFSVMRDSVFNAEKTKTISELEEKYQAELRQKQILELEQQNQIKDLEAKTSKQWQYGLALVLLLVTTLSTVLYNRYQLKQRTAKLLDEKNAELQKLNFFKDKMFAVISHDLRNPVDAFSNIIESLSHNSQHASKEELKEFLDSTLQSAKDLKGLLNNLLEWSLVQIGKLPFNPTAISLREVTQQSIAHLETMAAAKKITMHNNIDPGSKVIADPSMMIIALRNLISNAIKFSEPGKSIELTAQSQDGNMRLKVIDQGAGMSAEEVARLFKMEESTQSIGDSAEKGAGIGLLLVKELVDRNNGQVSVSSQPGKGSTFVIELPLIS